MLFSLSSFALAFSAAVLAARVARLHPEWRGGILSVAFLLLAVAANACEAIWAGWTPEWFGESEMFAILVFLAIAAMFALNAGHSVVTGFRAVFLNRRFSLFAWGIVLATVAANLAKNATFWELAFGVKGGHSERKILHDAVQFIGNAVLFSWALLFFRDKSRTFARRTSSLNALVADSKLVEIGRGTRRVAYRVGNTGYCVKFYYPKEQCIEELKMQKSIQRDVKWRRFDKLRNSSSAEVYRYKRFRHSMPDEIARRLPSVCERVFHPEWGWGVIETFYTNPDGSAIRPYEDEIAISKDPARRREIYVMARDLLARLVELNVKLYEPGNFHVLNHPDGTMELKIVDFEPDSKTAIPLEMFWPWFRRRKLVRKAVRYLSHVCSAYGIEIPLETAIG